MKLPNRRMWQSRFAGATPLWIGAHLSNWNAFVPEAQPEISQTQSVWLSLNEQFVLKGQRKAYPEHQPLLHDELLLL